jgi:hypothetical protein
MHPLSDSLKNMTFEELEKRTSDIHRKMQIMRRSGISNPMIWNQMEMLLNSINDEKRERAQLLNNPHAQQKQTVVLNTDPLPEDEPVNSGQPKNTGFKPVS